MFKRTQPSEEWIQEGNGRLVSNNGDVYVGDLCNNKPHGNGTIHYNKDDQN